MKITLIVEGKTEKAFLPYLRKFLESRLPNKMPRLDVNPYDGRIPTGDKLKRDVQRLLSGQFPSDYVLASTEKVKSAIKNVARLTSASEHQSLMLGRLLSEMIKAKKHVASLSEVEFKVFSQFGDDGIIQWLVSNLEFPNKTFVEFGVENYQESNTRFRPVRLGIGLL